MKATVSVVTLVQSDRTIDLTVNVTTDLNEAVSTETLIIPADQFTTAAILDRLNDLLDRIIRDRSTFPLTQAQAEAIALNMSTRVPG